MAKIVMILNSLQTHLSHSFQFQFSWLRQARTDAHPLDFAPTAESAVVIDLANIFAMQCFSLVQPIRGFVDYIRGNQKNDKKLLGPWPSGQSIA
jgi:hypothetical protein